MIEVIGVVLLVIVLVCIAALLSAGVQKYAPKVRDDPRDLCKRGCGIVHSVICGSGIVLEGLPLHCERAYCHTGRHEAGEDMDFRCWQNRDDPEDAVEQTVHGGYAALRVHVEGADVIEPVAGEPLP